jgi:hypothetical protein
MNAESKTKKFVENEEKFIRYEWKRYHTILFLLVFLLTLESFLTGSLQRFLQNLGEYEYVGAVFAGFFYTYGVTSPFSVATFFILADKMNVWLLAFLGALSSIVSEFIIYDFTRVETRKLLKSRKFRGWKIPKIKHTSLKKLSFIVAGFIIASPLPDELAAVLLGAENYDYKKFLALAFVFNFLGILFIAGLGRIF